MNSIEYVFATRLNSFGLGEGLHRVNPNMSVPELIRDAGTVPELDALELNYPEHFTGSDRDAIDSALRSSNLNVTGIQLRWPQSRFNQGAFSNPSPDMRKEAIQITKDAVDVCRNYGAEHVILWPAHDGYEYPFQVGYVQAWEWLIEAYSEVAKYASDIRVSIEYKPAEPRGRTLLDSTGAVLSLINQTGQSNLGVTLDFAHLLMANENPAQSAAMCLQQDKLYGVQLNDGYAKADDGLIVGSIHLPQTLEFCYYLAKYNYQGTFYFDTDPIREDPVLECSMNIARTKQLMNIANKLVAMGQLPNDNALISGSVWWDALVNAS